MPTDYDFAHVGDTCRGVPGGPTGTRADAAGQQRSNDVMCIHMCCCYHDKGPTPASKLCCGASRDVQAAALRSKAHALRQRRQSRQNVRTITEHKHRWCRPYRCCCCLGEGNSLAQDAVSDEARVLVVVVVIKSHPESLSDTGCRYRWHTLIDARLGGSKTVTRVKSSGAVSSPL